ncbi:transporter [Pseudonocardia sp. CNS-139]|nr:transporter [Pseudonocardia sp. CNS-139]
MVPVFLPAAVFGLGQGASAPVIALQARELGASVGVAGLIVAILGLGQVLGDMPAGTIVARIGERNAVLLGTAIGTVGVALCIFAWTPLLLGIGVGLSGVANAVWGLARQSYVVDTVPMELRGRALSAMAGLMRLGFLVGPFLGAVLVLFMGPRGGFVVQLAAVLGAGVLMLAMPRVASDAGSAAAMPLWRVLSLNRQVLRTLGLGAVVMGAARASRQAVLPLWADHIGLDPVVTSLLFGLGAAVDVALSYPAGRWMDMRGLAGRRPITVGSLILFAASHLALPLAGGVVSLAAVALLMGLANGLSNGVIQTIGADVAPEQGRTEFLGSFRLCHDVGMLFGPLIISGVSAAAGLAWAAAALGGVSGAGAAGFARWLPFRPQSSASVPASVRPSTK